eukprot:scaffold6308_cov111-Isochrysis_galbana.AAC.1
MDDPRMNGCTESAKWMWPAECIAVNWCGGVDNFGALACLVKGDSRDPDIGRLAHVLSAILVSIRARPWMDYVRSAANIADLPSRFDIGAMGIHSPLPTTLRI